MKMSLNIGSLNSRGDLISRQRIEWQLRGIIHKLSRLLNLFVSNDRFDSSVRIMNE